MKSLTIVYRYKDYKKYLFDVEKDISTHERGFRSRLSEALDVQNAFVSKVLNQPKVHFTLEQIMKLADFLELNKPNSVAEGVFDELVQHDFGVFACKVKSEGSVLGLHSR